MALPYACPTLQNISIEKIMELIKPLPKTIFKRTTYAAAGITRRTYRFGGKRVVCCSDRSVVDPIMNLLQLATEAHPDSASIRNLNLGHCTISIYGVGQYVPVHKDQEAIHKHFDILSISFGAAATMMLGGKPVNLEHGCAILFNGKVPHSTMPLEGVQRVNFTFRSWH